MAPKEGSSHFHPYDKPVKPSTRVDIQHRAGKTSSVTKHAKLRDSSDLSVNELKKRIRDVKRLLNHAGLPADARIVQERALANYQKDLLEATERRARSEMIKKYHFVRFLDRKAASKELRRLLRRQKDMAESNNPEALADIAEKIHTAQINVNYTIYYPLTEKYISLYPHDKKRQSKRKAAENDGDQVDETSGDDTNNGLLLEPHSNPDEKPPMWHMVEKCTADETLDLLRDGKLCVGVDGKPKTVPNSIATATATTSNQDDVLHRKKSGSAKPQKEKGRTDSGDQRRDVHHSKHKSHRREPEPMDEDDDGSDDGFFEE